MPEQAAAPAASGASARAMATGGDLLIDPIFSISGDKKKKNLPEILALLARGDTAEFLALRPHQQHPWYAFCVQLGALASYHHLKGDLPTEPGRWREALLALTSGEASAWRLVVENKETPAFLQPPCPKGDMPPAWKPFPTLDKMDVLATAKNVDVKMSTFTRPTAELCVFALLTLQTFQGYSGSGNYGIARMNGGYGSRSCVAIVTGLSMGERFARDVRLMIEARQEVIDAHRFHEHGKALLWLEPWNGLGQLALSSLDPFFIEVSRRVRLSLDAKGNLSAAYLTTKKPRIDAGETLGVVGDLWMPIDVRTKEPAAMSLQGGGFDYRRMRELLFADGFLPSTAQKMPLGEGPVFFLGQALSRGQGKTDGYHERILPIPADLRIYISDKDQFNALAEMAKQRVKQVDLMRLKCLKPALCSLLQGAPDKLDYKDERPNRWIDELDQIVDRVFFERLWACTTLSHDAFKKDWQDFLIKEASQLLERARRESPSSIAKRLRAEARSSILFRYLVKENFLLAEGPDLTPEELTSLPDGEPRSLE